jgi:cytochrome c-type biogenesis protein
VNADWAMAICGALWLGVLTSVSPCPLATNVAALSFLTRQVGRPSRVLASALSYTAGRAMTYTAVGTVAVLGLLSVPGLSQFLQRHLNQILGPVLVLVGMHIVGLINFGFSTRAGTESLRRRVAERGPWGALLLGMLFALSFCPVSAALFFGSLLPLSVRFGSRVLLPGLYGAGTALPVVLIALAGTYGVQAARGAASRAVAVERWASPVTGLLLVAVGIYLSIRFVFLA